MESKASAQSKRLADQYVTFLNYLAHDKPKKSHPILLSPNDNLEYMLYMGDKEGIVKMKNIMIISLYR